MSKTKQYFTLADNRKLCFSEYGSHDGFPIIYCHGSQSSRLEMHYDLSFAIDHHLRIITIDRPGHGGSDINTAGSILDFARDIKQLMTYLKLDQFSVAGMSAGAPFALGLSYLFPDNIYKTGIISGFAPLDKESKPYLSKEVKVLLGMAKNFPFLLRLLLYVQFKQLNKNPQKALQGFLKIMSLPDQEILKNNAVMLIIEGMFKEAFRCGYLGVAYEISNLLVKDWGFSLGDIHGSVTFWQGGQDNNVPAEWAEIMSSKIKGSNLKQFPKEGHLIIFEHAEEIFTDLKPTWVE